MVEHKLIEPVPRNVQPESLAAKAALPHRSKPHACKARNRTRKQ